MEAGGLPFCLFGVLLSPGFGKVLRERLRSDLYAFLGQLGDNLRQLEAARLHPLQRRGECQYRLLDAQFPVPCKGGCGAELVQFLSNTFDLLGGDCHFFFSMVGCRMPRFLPLTLSGQAARLHSLSTMRSC